MPKKPDGRKAKSNRDEGRAENTKPRYQKPHPVKEAGPRPASYEPNQARMQARETQRQAELATHAATDYSKFVAGECDVYRVSGRTPSGPETHMFHISERLLPKTDDKPETVALNIYGDVDVFGKPVWIPHHWIFRDTETRNYAAGDVGRVQRSMLQFLKNALQKELAAEKQLRYEARTAGNPVPEHKTAEVIDLREKRLDRDCRSIRDLMSDDPAGLYNFSDKDGTLIAELQSRNNGNVFIVKAITAGHHLAPFFVEGSVVRIDRIDRDCPYLDQHIRRLLTDAGIRVIVRPKMKRDRRAHVTEGLPNVRLSTQVAA